MSIDCGPIWDLFKSPMEKIRDDNRIKWMRGTREKNYLHKQLMGRRINPEIDNLQWTVSLPFLYRFKLSVPYLQCSLSLSFSQYVALFLLNKAKKQLENKLPLSSFIGRENIKSAKYVGVDKIDKRKRTIYNKKSIL